MSPLLSGFLPDRGQLRILATLVLASGLCAGLTALRVWHTHTRDHVFLLFNLALAWLPVVAALIAYNLSRSRRVLAKLAVLACAAIWLVFLPNAPYLITDLVHLSEREGIPFWYDVILLSTFAWTGLFLGLVSLVVMQEIVRRNIGQLTSWLFAAVTTGLVGYGVYLGRFLRWNSWDVVANPLPLAADIYGYLRHPFANFQTTVFSLIFAAVFASMYFMIVAVSQFVRDTHAARLDIGR